MNSKYVSLTFVLNISFFYLFLLRSIPGEYDLILHEARVIALGASSLRVAPSKKQGSSLTLFQTEFSYFTYPTVHCM